MWRGSNEEVYLFAGTARFGRALVHDAFTGHSNARPDPPFALAFSRLERAKPQMSVGAGGGGGLEGPGSGNSSGICPGNSSGLDGSPGSRTGGGISGCGFPGGLSRGGSVGCPGVIGGSSVGSMGIASSLGRAFRETLTAATMRCSQSVFEHSVLHGSLPLQIPFEIGLRCRRIVLVSVIYPEPRPGTLPSGAFRRRSRCEGIRWESRFHWTPRYWPG